MKEILNKFDFEDAFKALDELEYPKGGKIRPNRLDLKEQFSRKLKTDALVEDYYNLSSREDLLEAQEAREEDIAQAKLDRIEKIVDLDADSEEDLQAAYVGKFVIQCPQCMTLYYKKPEDVVTDENDPTLANVGELCPNCSNDSGFTLVGKIEDATPEPAPAEEIPAVEGEEVPVEGGEEAPAEGEEDLDLNLDLEGEGGEEDLDLNIEEQEPTEESLNLSKALKDASKNTELDTENHSENLTLNESDEQNCEDGKCDESVNLSKAQKDASKNTELDTENHSENLTLNEEIPAEILMQNPTNPNQVIKVPVKDGMVEIEDKDGKKINLKVEEAFHLTEGADIKKELKAYNEYIEYLQKEIEADEAALKTAANDFVKDSIQRRIDANKADLDSAMPEILKNATAEDAAIDDLAIDTGADVAAEEAPADEEQVAVEETEVKEALNEARDNAECEGKDCLTEAAMTWEEKVKKADQLLDELCAGTKILANPDDGDGYWYSDDAWCNRNLYYRGNFPKKVVDYLEKNIPLYNGKLPGIDFYYTSDEVPDNEYDEDDNAPAEVGYTLTDSVTTNEGCEGKDCKEDVADTIWKLGLSNGGRAYGTIEIDNLDRLANIAEQLDKQAESRQGRCTIVDATKIDPKSAEVTLPIGRANVCLITNMGKCGADVQAEILEKVDAETSSMNKSYRDPMASAEERKDSRKNCPIIAFVTTGDLSPAIAHHSGWTVRVPNKDTTVEEDVNILSGNSSSIDLGDAGAAIGAALPLLADDAGEKLVEEELPEEPTEAQIDDMLDSKEFKTPVTDAEIDAYFDEVDEGLDDDVKIKDVEELDDKSLVETVNKYLKEVYENVDNFELKECTFKETENKLVLEGLINFTSGNSKPTTFVLHQTRGACLEGYNFDLCETKAFRLYGKLSEDKKTFITEGLRYAYRINDEAVKGNVKYE